MLPDRLPDAQLPGPAAWFYLVLVPGGLMLSMALVDRRVGNLLEYWGVGLVFMGGW